MAKERSKRVIIEGEVNPVNLKHWNAYKRAKLIAGRSEKTLYNYECDIMQFFRYLNTECDDKTLEEIDEEDIEDYIGYCLEQGNNEKRIRRRISSLSSLLIYLKRKRKIKDNWCDYIERPGTGEEIQTRTFLTEEQLFELREKLKECDDFQLRVYIELGLGTMARSNELAQMSWRNVDFENRWIKDIKAKGNKDREYRISGELRDLLLGWKKYCEDNNINSEYILFAKYKGEYNQVNSSVLADRVKKAFAMIGIDRGFNHDLRHSMSNILKNRGVPIETVSQMLGHSGTDVTIKHYTIPNQDKFAEDYDKAFESLNI